MASIDERIKAELSAQNTDLAADDDLYEIVLKSFEGGSRPVMIGISIIAGLLACVLVWTIVMFVGAESTRDMVWWGVWTLMSGLALVLVELFAWMQINRASLRREIKLLEIQMRRAVDQ